MASALSSSWFPYVVIVLCVVGVAALIRWPPLGLAALIAGNLLAPVAVSTGTQTDLNFTILFLPVLLIIGFVQLVRRGDWGRLVSRPVLPVFALAATAVLSFGIVNYTSSVFAFSIGNPPWLAHAQMAPLPAQLGGVAVFILSAGTFFLAANEIRDVGWLQAVTWLFLGLAGLYLTKRLVPDVAAVTGVVFQKGADGSLFWTWLVALAFSQALLNRSLRFPLRLVLVCVVAAAFYVGLVESRDWLSGWMPPLLAAFAILWLGAPRVALVATLVAFVATAVKTPSVVGLVMSGDNQYSLTTRLAAWRVLADIARSSPIFGLGPSNYYHCTPLLSILGWHVHFSSHNTYVDILLQTGLLGLACFLWFAWEVGRIGWKLRTRGSAGFAHAYTIGALGGLVGTLAAGMLGDWVLPFVYNVTLSGLRASVLGWIFLGGLVALERMTPPESRQL
jgi:O-antigen ligase